MTPETLTLQIIAKGEIVSSNFAAFDAAARAWLAGINRKLATDDEFDQAAADVKKAKEVEDMMTATREAILANAVTINEELKKLNSLSDEMRTARLELSRQIDKAKSEQKEIIIADGLGKLECDRSMRPTFRREIEEAAKGKKSFDSMRQSVLLAVTMANNRIRDSKKLLDEFAAEHGPTLLPDRRNMEATEPTALAAELRRRVEAAAAQAEAKKLREAAAKAQQEAAAARWEAELAQAKQDVARLATTPTGTWVESPPVMLPVGQIPLSDEEKVLADEWAAFSETVRYAFAMLKPARESLQCSRNQRRAAQFAADVNTAWKGANQ